MSDVGLIGLAVMGRNLTLNLLEKQFKVSVYNRSESKTLSMIEEAKSQGLNKNLTATFSISDFFQSLRTPRTIFLMVQAGQPVDFVLEYIMKFTDINDIIVDGGNSNYSDTTRRSKMYSEKFLFVGCGISGGEEGARFGPCMMPGGDERAKDRLMIILNKISAKSESDNEPCTTWIGPDGSGHLIKMIHNGIEYAEMQLISEAYWFMKHCLHINNEDQSKIFESWNKSEMSSYLIEITANILKKKNSNNSGYIIDSILDRAGQKGTGKWTISVSIDFSQPIQSTSEAVFVRMISNFTTLRSKMNELYNKDQNDLNTISNVDLEVYLKSLEHSLLASRIISYSQGFSLIKKISEDLNWNLDIGKIAKIFRGGCIIRSRFLDHISDAYTKQPNLESLLLDVSYFEPLFSSLDKDLRKIMIVAIEKGLPMQATSSCLQYFDSLKSKSLPCNLIQAQRDYFGAHGYEEVGKAGHFVHTEWTDYSGGTTSGFYEK